ncbi:hypothetical protein JRO89_XS04G0073400 [Xanthoceras sorbifolium]|uniref:Uncharacterized protein n=1 Tax=Xanthoceras sorbifolium TaxID=99658 RepID=A0ABQ8I4G8_9ROSI|nr:hypothetical protein JRO89_XS04G0073400 [Xanthoceras sorbifolium]
MDKSMLGGLERLPQQDHARMASMIEHLQLCERDASPTVSTTLHTKPYRSKRRPVSLRCVEKLLKHSMRVGG